ncbi:MAG: hypothetical protein PF569_04675 [Candidatus Woesearchaeota archaeon]|jgi:hypothetical protein|nr:hypothetical protein [Candidatus Woesearchaeota archaeon]
MKIIDTITSIFSIKDKVTTEINVDYYDTNPLMQILSGNTTVLSSDFSKFYKRNSFVYAPIKMIANTVTKLEY